MNKILIIGRLFILDNDIAFRTELMYPEVGGCTACYFNFACSKSPYPLFIGSRGHLPCYIIHHKISENLIEINGSKCSIKYYRFDDKNVSSYSVFVRIKLSLFMSSIIKYLCYEDL